MQGLVVVGLISEEIPNINIKMCQSHWSAQYSQGHQVNVPAESVHREEVLYKVWWLKALQLRTYGRVTKRCKSQWSAKYRSKSPSQGTCRVRTLRRSTMQGLMVVGLIVEEILNVDVKCVKGTGAQI